MMKKTLITSFVCTFLCVVESYGTSISGPTELEKGDSGTFTTTLAATDLECPVDDDGNEYSPSSTITYTWTFPDGSTQTKTSATESVTYTFDTTGTHTVQVDLSASVSDSSYTGTESCTASDTISVTVFSISVTSDKSDICVGAKANVVHQATITISTSPAVDITVDMTRTGGDGATQTTHSNSLGSQTVGGNGAALSVSGATSTGSTGSVTTTLTSSDQAESSTIGASYDGGTEETTTVTFSNPSYSLVLTGGTSYGGTGTATVTVTHGGSGVQGHDIRFYLKSVVSGGTTYDASESDTLSQYISVPSGAVTTNSSGVASVTYTLGEDLLIDSYVIEWVDVSRGSAL